jgi:hypothetical protein
MATPHTIPADYLLLIIERTMNIKNYLFAMLVFPVSILLMNCSTPKESKTLIESKIPPGHAKIVGIIIEIEPVSDSSILNDPCSKAPCIALVKISSAVYGAAFPSFSKDDEIRIKFLYTLEKTTKELFPNMEEIYPGLKVGLEFIALVSHIENIDETVPKFQIHGYETRPDESGRVPSVLNKKL